MKYINILKGKYSQIRKNGFIHSVSVLVSGTAFAQALILLTTPILTRLYSPEDFSTLAVYSSLLAIVSVVSCLALEIAIPMPVKDEDAANLLFLALFFTLVNTCIVTITIYLLPVNILSIMGFSDLLPYWWMLPLGIFLTGSYNAFQYFSIRQKEFLLISKARVTQSVTSVTSQIGLGFFEFSPFGLLFGQILNAGSGAVYLGKTIWRTNKSIFRNSVSINEMLRQFIEYRRFPQYTTFEFLFNSAGVQIPIIIIATLTIGPEAGFLMLAMRVMQMPMGLLGRAIAQVYLSKASEQERNKSLSQFTEKVILGLFKAGVGPLILTGLIAPPVFSFIFGQEWMRAGELVTWMTFWFVFQFLSSPISMVMHVKNNQQAMLIVTFTGLIIRVGSIVLAALFLKNYFSEFYAISGGIFYFGCYIIFSRAAGLNFYNILSICWQSKIYLVAWSGAGLIIRFLLC